MEGQGECRVDIIDTATGCQELKDFIDAQTVPTTYVLGPGTFVCPRLDSGRGIDISEGKDVVIQGQGDTSTVLDLDQLGRLAFVVGSLECRNLKVQRGKVNIACVA